MEKKTAKKTTKAATKTAPKTVATETVCNCNCGDNKDILNKIFYSLIAIIVILALILVELLVNGGNINTSSKSTESTTEESSEEENTEYDVSMFDTLTTTDAMAKIADGNEYVVYIGRSTCGYCVKFLPSLQQAQEEYGYITIYIDLEQMTQDDMTNIKTIDDEDGYIAENLGYTPMVLIFKDGKLKKGWVGYAET